MKKIKLFIAFFFLVIFVSLAQNKPYEIYTVQEGETLQSISRKLSITPYSLLKLNPDVKDTNLSLEGIKVLIVPNKNYNPNAAASKAGKDYVENGFLIHTVLPKENFWRLKKEYGVAKRILRKYNPILRSEDLKAGQVIKIPVDEKYEVEGDEVQVIVTKPYMVKPKETKYGISRRYGITIEKLEELNPQTKGVALKMTDIILVPDTAEIPDAKEGFITHRIEKGDNYFQLKQKFGVTEENLLAINPELKEGLKLGMLIRIPIEEEVIITSFEPQIILGRKINAVLMLPFMSNKTNVDFEKSKTANIATDFYLGAMIALDSLKKQGLSVNMKVLDTKNSKTVISGLIASGDFTNTNVVIGPLFYNNVEFIANTLRNNDISIISPVSQKDHSTIVNNKLIQDTPSDEKLMDRVLSYIKRNYNGEKIVVFSDTTEAIMPKLIKTLKILEPLDSLTKIEIVKPVKGYIKPNLFREKITDKKDNWIILVSDDPIVTTDVVQNLGVLPKKTKATLFAYNKGSNFNNVDNNYLAHINFHYPTDNYVDLNATNVQKFIKKYKDKNYVEPSEYAFKGFDVTYDALLRLASHEDMSTALKAGYSERTSSKFEYDSKGYGKGFTNQGVYLIKYDGLNLVKVVEESKISSK